MDYKASTDLTVKLTTGFVLLLFCFIAYRMVIALMADNVGKQVYIYYGIIAFLIATLFFSFGYSARGYRVDADHLIIVEPITNKVINKSDIKSAELIDHAALGSVIRTGGNGGLFGYYGWYRSSAVGSIFYYATQKKNLILIELKDGEKCLITPDDTSILAALK